MPRCASNSDFYGHKQVSGYNHILEKNAIVEQELFSGGYVDGAEYALVPIRIRTQFLAGAEVDGIQPAPKNRNGKPSILKGIHDKKELQSWPKERFEELGYSQSLKALTHVLKGDEVHRDAVFSEGGRIHGEFSAIESMHEPGFLYWPRDQHTVFGRAGAYEGGHCTYGKVQIC